MKLHSRSKNFFFFGQQLYLNNSHTHTHTQMTVLSTHLLLYMYIYLTYTYSWGGGWMLKEHGPQNPTQLHPEQAGVRGPSDRFHSTYGLPSSVSLGSPQPPVSWKSFFISLICIFPWICFILPLYQMNPVDNPLWLNKNIVQCSWFL